MLKKILYSCIDTYGDTHYSFKRDVLEDYEPKRIKEHDAAEFFQNEADVQASGHDKEHSKIAKRELVELFCEIYKV